MNSLKTKHLSYFSEEDFTDHWFILRYMQYKHAPEAEKLAKLTGIYTLLSPLCPDGLRSTHQFFAAHSPRVSLEEYVQLHGDDGYHWNSKRLAGRYCYSLYPTLEMLQKADFTMVMPRNCLVRFIERRVHPEGLIGELFDWKI